MIKIVKVIQPNEITLDMVDLKGKIYACILTSTTGQGKYHAGIYRFYGGSTSSWLAESKGFTSVSQSMRQLICGGVEVLEFDGTVEYAKWKEAVQKQIDTGGYHIERPIDPPNPSPEYSEIIRMDGTPADKKDDEGLGKHNMMGGDPEDTKKDSHDHHPHPWPGEGHEMPEKDKKE